MLYEVITTIPISSPTPKRCIASVITSYSIHYTKLYELFRLLQVFLDPPAMLASGKVTPLPAGAEELV